MSRGNFQARLKSAEFELTKKDLFQHQIINREGQLNKTIAVIAKIIRPRLKAPHAPIDKKPKAS